MSNVPNRIALIGRSGSGKTTCATFLTETYGHVRLTTGGICREISHMLFGDESRENLNCLTDTLKSIDRSIFLKAALRAADLHLCTVIDSLRYYSDYEIARAEGYTVLRVNTARGLRRSRLCARGQLGNFDIQDLHPSETELDGAETDLTLFNNATPEVFRASVACLFMASDTESYPVSSSNRRIRLQ